LLVTEENSFALKSALARGKSMKKGGRGKEERDFRLRRKPSPSLERLSRRPEKNKA